MLRRTTTTTIITTTTTITITTATIIIIIITMTAQLLLRRMPRSDRKDSAIKNRPPESARQPDWDKTPHRLSRIAAAHKLQGPPKASRCARYRARTQSPVGAPDSRQTAHRVRRYARRPGLQRV
jgi:hypothetical protein